LLRAYPFILPNIVGCLFCLIAYILVVSFVEETLPVERRQSFGLHTIFPSRNKIMRNVSSFGLFKHLYEGEAEISKEIITLMPHSKEEEGHKRAIEEEKPATICSLLKRKSTREHLLVYWFYSFLIIGLDETFPLFCLSKVSGLGIQEKDIGDIFSGTGFFYITIQYFLLTGLVRRFGFYKTMRIGAFCSVPFACLIPLSVITNKDVPEGTLAFSTFFLLSLVYAIVRVFSLLVFSTLTMTTNRTVSAYHRGTMQGLSMLGGSVAKACGPTFGGILFSSSVRHFPPPLGSVVVFSIFSLLGISLAMQTLLLSEPEAANTVGVEVEHGSCVKDDDPEKKDGPPTF